MVPLACLTLAVRVTGEFAIALVADAVRIVDVLTAAGFTVMATTLELDALKATAPE